jgi:hypothetical protein
MKRFLLVLAIAGAAAQAGGAGAARQSSIALKIGDAVDVVGTKIACYAIHSSGKDGMACVLLKGSKPAPGTYGAGLAVDGTAVITFIKANGTATPVFKRRLQATKRVYRVHVGDSFGLQITPSVALGCQVINVTSTLVAPMYRGLKVSCFRATATHALPNTYGVSISGKVAGWYRIDSKSRVTSQGKVWRQTAP